MERPDNSNDRLVQSVTRAFDVLFAVASGEGPQTVGSLSKSLSLPRPTIHRIMNTLVASGVVSRVHPGKSYVVTPKLALATTANTSTATLGDLIVPFLHRLVAMSEETASLHVRVGDLRVCVAEVQGSRGIRWARGPGWSAPLWSGAVGRLLLAGLDDAERDEVLARSRLHALASNTVIDEAELKGLIARAQKDGWSSSESETVDGAAATAAPVCDANGRTIAALSLYASADRLSHMISVVPELRRLAAEASTSWIAMSPFGHVISGEPDFQKVT